MAYVKRDPITHILTRPDMYVGSKQFKTIDDYVYENGAIAKRQISYSPALSRCFGEILSNAIDNAERDGQMTKIVVEVTPTTCSILNDGAIIPIELTEKERIYNHSLIFGHLLSGSNYDDTEKRFTSGRNGLGAKLTNVFSTTFTVEAVDPDRRLCLTQTWTNNMRKEGEAKVCRSALKRGYTKVTFQLDLAQFGVQEIPPDSIALFARQVVDAAMTTGLKVTLNGQKLTQTKIDAYWNLVRGRDVATFKCGDDSTTVVITPSIEGFEAISFVNGIRTKGGGKHVDGAVEAVCRPIVTRLGGKVTLRDVKSLLGFLVVSRLPNPEFDSQEKSILESPSVKLAHISSANVSKILKMTSANGSSLSAQLKSFTEEKETKLLTKTVASKSLAIDGYDKANYASTSKAADCVLIVCEGLSAKTFAVAGMEKGLYGKRGRNYLGIYPLRGKLLNTRNASVASIAKNTVITNLVKILGLDFSKPKNLAKLSYGKLCVLTDADCDGIHIESLILNFLHSMFPALLEREFVVSMKTPILKVTRNLKTSRFYYDERTAAEAVREKNVRVKYFKGLGTTKTEDVKDIFGVKMLEFFKDDETDETFRVAFDKNATANRRDWIGNYDPAADRVTLDQLTESRFSITTLLNSELVKFFYEDCSRTLPSVFDGLKESQRKVLYAAQKRNLVDDLKVAQFGAYVAEHTSYHHGETNLFGTIIKMAQSFTGANNVPLFAEEGMFGTRLSGGEDAASPRYIFTKMTRACMSLFPKSDEYEKRFRDSDVIEPAFYVPILPLLLINGCVGIASGWMCSCPCFQPAQVLTNARRAISGQPALPMKPWYRGFRGKVVSCGAGKYETRGTYERVGNKIVVSELPVGLWNDKFRLACEQDDTIAAVKDLSTPTTPAYELVVGQQFDEKAFEKRMRSSVNVNNIVAFDERDRIVKLTVDDVFSLWAKERLARNATRKARQLANITSEMAKLRTRIAFIKLVRTKVIDLTLDEKLVVDQMTQNDIRDESLLNIPLRQLTNEKRLECERKLTTLLAEFDRLDAMSKEDIWEEDVKALEEL